MPDRTVPQTDKAIIDSRALIDTSRRHLASIRDGLRDGRSYMDAMRQDLDAWRQDLRWQKYNFSETAHRKSR